LEQELTRYVEQQLDGRAGQNRKAIVQELREIFTMFFRSNIFTELASANILGRETPLLMPWDGQIMEGVIDLLYERKGLLYIADYKTDRIVSKAMRQARDDYRYQAEVYSRAVRQSLRREVTAFKLIFLRAGEAIEVKPDPKQGELFLTESS